jgi:hypothetical protein
MRHLNKFLFCTSLLALLAGAITFAASQEKSGEKPQAARPGAAEMARLKFYLGEWEYTEEYPKSAFYPSGGKNTGIYTSKLGPGGNSLINTFHSQGPVGDFEGLLVMTWDPKEKVYKEYLFGDSFPGAIIQTGVFEGESLVYRTEFSAGGKTVKLRNVAHLTSDGKIESEEYVSTNDGPEALMVRVVATRKTRIGIN